MEVDRGDPWVQLNLLYQMMGVDEARGKAIRSQMCNKLRDVVKADGDSPAAIQGKVNRICKAFMDLLETLGSERTSTERKIALHDNFLAVCVIPWANGLRDNYNAQLALLQQQHSPP